MSFGKVVLWALAIIGGAFVFKKYAYPKLMSMSNGENKQIGTGKLSMRVIACNSSGSPVPGGLPANSGVQSSSFWRWCYFVKPGDSAGSISERITGDSSRYIEILTANPDIPKKGKMGEVTGPNAWDFADGQLVEGTKLFIPQTMNAWIDQFGVTKAAHYPFPPDPRTIFETGTTNSLSMPAVQTSTTTSSTSTSTGESFEVEDGFDYVPAQGA